MLKKQWNTSKLREKGNEKVALCLLPFVCCLLFFSCAPKYAEKPSREGLSLSDVLAKMNTIQSIEAVLSIDYEKNDSTMSGDAFLNLSPAALDLRIYYLGFLAGEVKEDNGVIKSKPKLDKFKSVFLVDGLRNSFLWWTISDYTIQDREDSYVLRNFNRQLIISKKNLLPLEQTIQLDNGEEMTISYDEPAYNKPAAEKNRLDPEIAWYQSHLSIRYKNHQVKVRVKSYTATIQKTAGQQ
ncbi:MAG TPA: hypothetical protein VJW95_07395 [Dissulfurispiraceae bacterium]|nr:hypothetical protein [Dissulfurispiraceae bacterium]